MAKKQKIGYQPIDTAYTRDIDTWFIVVMILFLFPIGLWLMWTRTSWKKWVKIVVTVIVALFFVTNAISIATEPPASPSSVETTEAVFVLPENTARI